MTAVSTQTVADLFQSLLHASGWRNNRDCLIEAFPHMSERLHPEDIAQTLDNLSIPYEQVRCRARDITAQDCPALILPDYGAAYLALDRKGPNILVGDDSHSAPRLQKPNAVRCTLFRIDRFTHQQTSQGSTTVAASFGDLRPMLPGLLITSLLVNTLGLFAPLLIMAIYDRVIPSGSVDMLLSLAIGVTVIAATDLCFRHARTRVLAYVGWQGERRLTISLFQKLMSLPLTQLQSSDVHQQLSRFRQFEALRDMFTGQLMTSLLDLPFAMIFLAVLLYLAPQVGLLTLGFVVALAMFGVFTIPYQKRLDKTAAETSSLSQASVQDAIVHQRALANLGMQEQWLQRCLPMIRLAEDHSRQARQFQALTQAATQTVTALATAGAIILSAHGAMIGELSFGALIASIALVSKVMAPVQALFAGFPQILTFQSSRRQADRVLSLPQEMELGLGQSHQKALSGAIAFSSVTYRPDPVNPPLLSQVSFTCSPGETVVILSNDAAARGAILDLMDGLVSPVGGTIEHDGIDIRQIARDELRKSITYATYEKSMFFGTVAQNFRLTAPSMSDADIAAMCEQMGLLKDKGALPDGIQSRLTDEALARMPDETLASLTLARSMARTTSIYLFSEPTRGLSDTARQVFKDWVRNKAGPHTIVIATADRSFLQIADRFVFLNDGRVVVNDTGEAGLKKLQAALKSLGG